MTWNLCIRFALPDQLNNSYLDIEISGRSSNPDSSTSAPNFRYHQRLALRAPLRVGIYSPTYDFSYALSTMYIYTHGAIVAIH